ncbi:hypothetical protein [Acinetobacter indicus]|uniref:hypothetical protein n=1 Tax=Acinetobacter indicus TaxID=756892 RepID=UPI002578E17C|nr:hypothetical protein [Acinetobacter indicus]MDM1491978.1 hypothetical protein [Acinetobacter indicus]
MVNLDFEDIFSPIVLKEGNPSENLKNIDQKLKDQKTFFLKNIHKNKIPTMIFNKLGYGYLLHIDDNTTALKKLLDNSNFIKLFKISDMTLDEICMIIFIYDKSSEYYINSLKLKQKKDKETIDDLEKNYNYFSEKSKDVLDFNEWLNQKLDSHLNIAIRKLIESKSVSINIDLDLLKKEMKNDLIIFSNSDVLFLDYLTDAHYLVDAKNPFAPKEKNLRINFFVRELKNIFNNRISNQIFFELTSTLFNHELDETGIKNILKNTNTNPINTQLTTQITVGDENNTVEHFKFIDIAKY